MASREPMIDKVGVTMSKRLFTSVAVVTLISLATAAQATVTVYKGLLTGSQEVPAVASAGFGTAYVTIDDVANTMRVAVTFGGLTGLTTASHIHCCALPGFAAGVATQTPSFTGFPLGVQAGLYDRTFDLTLASTYRAGFITASGGTVSGAMAALMTGLVDGKAYFNVHTAAFPGGEIRGQLAATAPEPATWALMISGFGLTGVMLRRRRAHAA